MPGKIFGHDRSLIYCCHKKTTQQAAGLATPEPQITSDIQEIEFDEMRHFIKKDKKCWVIKAFDRGSRRTVGWVLGSRGVRTFCELYDKIKHLEHCTFYTDAWDAFAKVLPKERHTIGKQYTVNIEQDNGNTRHHLGRFTRRTKVVSKSELMVDLSLRLWNALTQPAVFKQYQQKFIGIFK